MLHRQLLLVPADAVSRVGSFAATEDAATSVELKKVEHSDLSLRPMAALRLLENTRHLRRRRALPSNANPASSLLNLSDLDTKLNLDANPKLCGTWFGNGRRQARYHHARRCQMTDPPQRDDRSASAKQTPTEDAATKLNFDAHWLCLRADGSTAYRPFVNDTTHPHHGIDYIEISVSDIEQAKTFYRTAFDWTFNDYGPTYAGIIKEGGGESGGLAQSDTVTQGGPLVVLYSKDLEATLAGVKAAGGTIVKEPFDFPGGRRFHFSDPSGNELAVWSLV